jgi:predicted alpha/beta hydrolase
MIQEKIRIQCTDGVSLAALLLLPQHPKSIVQFNSATATPKEFYLPFAHYLAENDFIVLLFDYRGICESTPEGGLKNCSYEYTDWATKDVPAVLDYLTLRFPSLSVFVVGHSVGGQMIGLVPNLYKISGMVTIASSSGYWGFMPFIYRLQTHFFFEIVRPITHLLYGFTAAKKLKIMENLPPKITNQWRKWCSVEDYFFDKKYFHTIEEISHFDKIPFPIQLFWLTDDAIAGKRNVESFWKHVKSTEGITLTEINPTEVGLKEIGHFGFFRKKYKAELWPFVLKKLNAFIGK